MNTVPPLATKFGRRSARGIASIIAALLVLVGVITTTSQAHAVEISGTISNVTTDKTTYGYNEKIQLSIDWSVPDTSQPGDTFSMTLPPELNTASLAKFNLNSPDGTTVAVAMWEGKTVVFTLTDYVLTHDNVAGTAYFKAQWDHQTVTTTGGPVKLEFVSSVTTVNIDPKPAPCTTNCFPTDDRTERGLWKGSSWTDGAYEGTRDESGNINWLIEMPGDQVGYAGPVDVLDTIGAGSIIDCPVMKITVRNKIANGNPAVPLDASRYTLDCTPEGFHIVLDKVNPSEFIDIRYTGTITDQSVGTYTNHVEVTYPGKTWTKTSTIVRTDAGGDGGGTQNVSVGNYVWLDANKNGLQDLEENGIPNVTLTLTGPTGEPVTGINGQVTAPTATDSDGHYSFTGLPVLTAGQHYTVAIDGSSAALKGLTPTTPAMGSDRGQDSSTETAVSGDLTTNHAEDTTLDFGFNQPSVTVGDYVWLDSSNDGRQDEKENGIPGVVLILAGPDGQTVTNIHGELVESATTDDQGQYLFTELPVLDAGDHYRVSIDRSLSTDALALYKTTQAEVGDSKGDSSTWTSESQDLTTDGASDLSLDFGFVLQPVLSTTPPLPIDPPVASPHAAPQLDSVPTAILASTGSAQAFPLGLGATSFLLLGAAALMLRRHSKSV